MTHEKNFPAPPLSRRGLLQTALGASAALAVGTFPAAVKAACALTGYPAGAPLAPVRPLDKDQVVRLQDALRRAKNGA